MKLNFGLISDERIKVWSWYKKKWISSSCFCSHRTVRHAGGQWGIRKSFAASFFNKQTNMWHLLLHFSSSLLIFIAACSTSVSLNANMRPCLSLWGVFYQYLTKPTSSFKAVKQTGKTRSLICKHLNYFRTTIMSHKIKEGEFADRKITFSDSFSDKDCAWTCRSGFKSCVVSRAKQYEGLNRREGVEETEIQWIQCRHPVHKGSPCNSQRWSHQMRRML